MKRIRIILLTIFAGLLLSTDSYGQKSPISVYGYFDLVGRDFLRREFPNGAKEDPPPSFSLLRTHILFNSRFSEDWRAFINIRFQSGGDIGAGEDHDDKGEIQILEAWFEYHHRDWLRVRGGQFLAPFGYFNSRKFQSPIFNSVVLPVMYEEEFLRRSSAGTIIPPSQNLQVRGRFRSKSWTLGYNLYIGNGSSTDENNLDVNTNKGLGSRLWIEPAGLNLTLGISYYTEKSFFTLRPHMDKKAMIVKAQSLGINLNEVLPILPVVTESETRHTLGFDTRFLLNDFEIRGEYVKSRMSDLKLVDASAIFDTTQTYIFDGANFSKTFYYVNINYIVLEKVTPFLEINVFKDPRHFVFRNELRRLTLGISYRQTTNVVLKAEFHNHVFGDEFNKQPNNFKSFQMVWTSVSILFD